MMSKIKFAGHEWCKIVTKEGVILHLDRVIECMRYQDIDEYLEKFLNTFSKEDKNKIKKVGILSKEELEKYFPKEDRIRKIDGELWWYWTSTTSHDYSGRVYRVDRDGSLGFDRWYSAYRGYRGVVPALYLKSEEVKQ